MKDILKLGWKVIKRVAIPFIKRKAKELLKSYLWSVAKTVLLFVACVAAVVAFILIFLR